MKKHRKLWVGLALLTPAICGFALTARSIYEEAVGSIMDLPVLLAESKSPADLGEAAFYKTSGFTDSSIEFYIFDLAVISRPIFVGGPYATDGPAKMKEAIWSKDGSVVAVLAKYGSSSEQQGSSNSSVLFVDAYDFREHKAIGERSDMFERVNLKMDVRRNSQLIADLIARRGGRGKAALADPYGAFAPSRELSEQEAALFKK